MRTRILFVCLGNICRSPTAHGVMQHKVQQMRLTSRIEVDSAGTSDWHVGRPPDTRSIACASSAGYDLGLQRARQVSPADFAQFDYILAMDEKNLAELNSIVPKGFSGHLGLFLDVLSHPTLREMPDPYYGEADAFKQVLSLAESACDKWIERIVAPQR
ncbi:MAG: low molecular weight phosphotyrosine protein phosphatase [Sphingobacteriales bacterium]|nr:MAG: low molecular weight phosphotyrosine protein phosphatase [Sphingobacteriales bacterium]